MRWAWLAFGAAACTSTSPPTAPRATLAVTGQARGYIVTLSKSANPRSVASEHSASPRFVYEHALTGFAATLSEEQVARLRRHPLVTRVEPDVVVSVYAPEWGLDRIDQRALPLGQTYSPQNRGAGVTAYILDTGIRLTHQEYASRVSSGWDFIDNDADASDCHGHGTHVAGTVGGATVGVANQVRLVSVRVLGCNGSGDLSQVIAGVDWVTAHAVKPAVANMSLGGSLSESSNEAVAASVASGVTYAVAAGNSNNDACLHSPASEPSALTAGATTITDARASFSSFGPCVDLFAPGQDVRSSVIGSDASYGNFSGTSMASPHVAGVAAIYLSAFPTASPATVSNALRAWSTRDVVTNPGFGSQNLLLYSQVTVGTPPPIPPPPPPPAPGVHAGLWQINYQPKGAQLHLSFANVTAHTEVHATVAGAVAQTRITTSPNVGTFVQSCTTGADGRCSTPVVKIRPPTNTTVVITMCMTGLVAGPSYVPAANHNPTSTCQTFLYRR